MSAQGEIERTTKETSVSLSIGPGRHRQFGSRHRHRVSRSHAGCVRQARLFDLKVDAKGDLEVDEHHTIEDTAICLGRALNAALGEARGIVRVGHSYVPLDEALARVVVDLSGRGYCVFRAEFDDLRVGQLETDMVRHFFETLAIEGRLNLHAEVLHGRNDHHRIEALYKGLGGPWTRRAGSMSGKPGLFRVRRGLWIAGARRVPSGRFRSRANVAELRRFARCPLIRVSLIIEYGEPLTTWKVASREAFAGNRRLGDSLKT